MSNYSRNNHGRGPATKTQYSELITLEVKTIPSDHQIDDLASQLSQTYIKSRPHESYPAAAVKNLRQVDALQEVICDVLTPRLKTRGNAKLLPGNPCFDLARKFAKRWDISENAVDSHVKLACGYLKFPVIMLLNPAPTHERLPFDQMVDGCRTLRWIKDVLYRVGLGLGDVIVLDACTLLGSDRIRELDRKGLKQQALSEAYDVTQKMLKVIKPDMVISCQCSTSFSTWNAGGHVIAREVCSSIKSARKGEVRKVIIDGLEINVIQAYHPSGFLNRKGHHDPSGRLLEDLFRSIFIPCANWKSHHIMALAASVEKIASISTKALTAGKVQT